VSPRPIEKPLPPDFSIISAVSLSDTTIHQQGGVGTAELGLSTPEQKYINRPE
jgi:hypothetical protein